MKGNTMTAEILILALTIYSEAQGEPWRGKAAVTDVIVTRSRQSGKTLAHVCTQPKQFSGWNNLATMNKLIAAVAAGKHRNDYAWKDCLALAELASRPGYRVKIRASHFYAPARVKRVPSWVKAMREVAVISGHRFMIEKKNAK